MFRVLLCGAMLIGVLLISGCAANSLGESRAKIVGGGRECTGQAAARRQNSITVRGEDKTQWAYQVDQSGQISLPLTRTITGQDLTQAELEQQLAKKFRSEYFAIATLEPFYMMSEVQKPREYPYQSGLNVLTAMAIAGDSAARRDQHARLSDFDHSPDSTGRCDQSS